MQGDEEKCKEVLLRSWARDGRPCWSGHFDEELFAPYAGCEWFQNLLRET